MTTPPHYLSTSTISTGLTHMFTLQCQPNTALRCAFAFLSAALCLAIAACGGGRNDAASAQDGGPTVQAASPSTSTSVAGSDRRATPLAATPSKGTGRPGDPLIPTPIPAPSAGQQLTAEITRLEQQGALPKLDRSTDLRGPDANNNGVRDDVEAYIATLPLTDVQKSASLQMARNQQRKLLVDPTNKQAVAGLSEQSIAATNCLVDVFGEDATTSSYALVRKIQAISANTPERAKRYMGYMAALSGTSVSYPDRDTCEH